MSHELNILLCDDNADDRFFFKVALEKVESSTCLETVNDGEELMLRLKNKEHLPNVIFLDLNMPRKNGFECLKEIMQDEILKKIPVVIFSTTDQAETIKQTYNEGASLYLIKPSNLSKLSSILNTAIEVIAKREFNKPSVSEYVIS